MTNENLDTSAFVFRDEMEHWKIVKFRFDNVFALRETGEHVHFDSEDDAVAHVRREAARALLKYALNEFVSPPLL